MCGTGLCGWYAVNGDAKESFTIRKRELLQSPIRQKPEYKIAPNSPWNPSWDVCVRDMYLYDFKFNPPSTESQKRQFREWLETGTHDNYKRWLEEPLGTIDPPVNISEWIYQP